jgi:BirA family transcriptional regulator, biotin operon repressor / biotin---[acetyl-CoA-carboxylase] ligase
MRNIHYFQYTTSTNRIAYDLALSGEPEGVAVIAEAQAEGRGRLGRVWQSPPGKGLYCSIIVRPRITAEDYTKITLTAGLAVAIALEEASGLEMRLKWPNDVYVGEKKCCGILTEASSLSADNDNRFAIVGIGINVNSVESDFSPDLQGKITSLRMFSGAEYNIMEIFHKVRASLLKFLSALEEKGFPEILIEWRKRDFLIGKSLQWLSTSGDIVSGESYGPDESGRLVIQDKDGTLHQILSGDVSLANKSLYVAEVSL